MKLNQPGRAAGIHLNKDFGAGLIVVAAGLFAAVTGASYKIGTLQHTGPGLFPTLLGAVLVLVGLGIMASGFRVRDSAAVMALAPDIRGSICIILGVLAFILAGEYLGMLAGSFACVFVAALGDRSGSWKSSLLLGVGLAAFSAILFGLFLRIQMPILRWG
jgi:hypothetical protein